MNETVREAILWRWPTAQFEIRGGAVTRWDYPLPQPPSVMIERAVYEYSLRNMSLVTDIVVGLLRLNLAVQSVFIVPLKHDVQQIELINPQPVGVETVATIIFQSRGVRRSVAWGKYILWPGGVAPMLSKSGDDIVRIYTWTAGHIWYGRLLGADYRTA